MDIDILSIEIIWKGHNLKYIMQDYIKYYQNPPPQIFPIIEKEVLIKLIEALKRKLMELN